MPDNTVCLNLRGECAGEQNLLYCAGGATSQLGDPADSEGWVFVGFGVALLSWSYSSLYF